MNTDGNITISDVTMIQRAAADLVQLTSGQKSLADVNGDGVVDVIDATCLQKFLAEFFDGTGNAGQLIYIND